MTADRRPNPVDLIAWVFMRSTAFMPNKVTEEKAAQAIRDMLEDGWEIVDTRTGERWEPKERER